MMTANFTSLGLDSGFETGIRLIPEQVHCLITLSEEWRHCCRWVLEKELALKNIHSEILEWEGDSLVLKTVRDQYVDEMKIEAPSMEEFLNPTFSFPDPPKNELYAEARYTVDVHPPVLPKKAKPILAESLSWKEKKNEDLVQALSQYPMYIHRGTTYLVVQDDTELPEALPLANANRWSVVVRE